MQNDKEKFKTELKRRIYAWVLRLIAFLDIAVTRAQAAPEGGEPLASSPSRSGRPEDSGREDVGGVATDIGERANQSPAQGGTLAGLDTVRDKPDLASMASIANAVQLSRVAGGEGNRTPETLMPSQGSYHTAPSAPLLLLSFSEQARLDLGSSLLTLKGRK